ncbi:aspartic proteinase CDR1-like [Silene latifolia]|uniref:aspartic proteinase CDR1-like n=1 Tax=Silene latifolia TaxID=37657 RepID=UPI003D785A9A
MLHNILFPVLFYYVTSLTSSRGDGFTASLIPPISPRSPFYSQILAANKIPITLTNITLNRTHYQKWVQTKRTISKNDYDDVVYKKDAYYFVTELYIGDPVQLVYGIFDTGSDIVWVQCEGRAGKGNLAYYNQSKSSSYKVVDCKDSNRCQTNRGDLSCSTNPSDNTSCIYSIGYLSGDYSKGVISSDIISLKPNWEVLQDFVFGCSNDNPLHHAGILGASNSVYSMPKQIYPDDPKFSYCISGISTKTNFVKFGIDANLTGHTVKILQHPRLKYYYMDVSGVQVNGIDIKVDPSIFAMAPDGLTGFVIDSGYGLTSLSSVAFDALKDSLYQILGPATIYNSVFEICYPGSKFGTFWPYKPRPKIGIRFRDWVLELEESNVWHITGSTNLECLQVQRTLKLNNISVLGAEQLFDVNVGHDPINNLLYLQPMDCPTGN